jgi:hypothetical protein
LANKTLIQLYQNRCSFSREEKKKRRRKKRRGLVARARDARARKRNQERGTESAEEHDKKNRAEGCVKGGGGAKLWEEEGRKRERERERE